MSAAEDSSETKVKFSIESDINESDVDGETSTPPPSTVNGDAYVYVDSSIGSTDIKYASSSEDSLASLAETYRGKQVFL